MRGSARLATYLGRVMMALGFLLMVVAWDGAAELDRVPGQFPYLLSGAIPGLALIVVGTGLEYVQMTRELTATRARQMAQLDAELGRLLGAVRDGGGLIGARAMALAPPPAPPPEPRLQALEISESAFAPPADPADGASTLVVAGRSSFHDPSCHLVSGRSDMTYLPREEAVVDGLASCRICKP